METKSSLGIVNIFFISICCLMLATLNLSAQISGKEGWDSIYHRVYGNGDPLLEVYNDETGDFSWHGHYWLRAYVSMAGTFDDSVYLDKAVNLIDHLFQYTDKARYDRGEIDLENEPYVSAPLYYLNNRTQAAPGWRNMGLGDGWRIQTLNDGLITNAILRFVDIVLTDDNFVAYRPKANQYLEKVEKIVNSHNSLFEFNRFPDVAGTYYYPKPDGSGLYSGDVPFNHNAAMGVSLLLLDKVKGGVNEYHQKAAALINYFKKFAKIMDNNSYIWNYDLRKDNTSVEDFNHAHIDLSFLILAHLRGLELTEEDLQRFANTLTKNVYQDNGKLNWFIDGTTDKSQDGFWPIGFDWIDLAQFNPFILDIAKKFYSGNYPDPTWSRPLLGWAEIWRWNSILLNGADNIPPSIPKNVKISE